VDHELPKEAGDASGIDRGSMSALRRASMVGTGRESCHPRLDRGSRSSLPRAGVVGTGRRPGWDVLRARSRATSSAGNRIRINQINATPVV
jgi:hypothetical protein